MALDADGRLTFVNTLFGCLATLSDDHSFKPVWRPSFVSQLVAEDRCHLNGLAMVDGRPKYVTAASQSDVADGWRDWTCPAKVPDTYLIYTATVSNARGLFPPSVECLRRGL